MILWLRVHRSFRVETKLSSSIIIVPYYSCHILTSQPFKCQDSRQPSLRYGLSGRWPSRRTGGSSFKAAAQTIHLGHGSMVIACRHQQQPKVVALKVKNFDLNHWIHAFFFLQNTLWRGKNVTSKINKKSGKKSGSDVEVATHRNVNPLSIWPTLLEAPFDQVHPKALPHLSLEIMENKKNLCKRSVWYRFPNVCFVAFLSFPNLENRISSQKKKLQNLQGFSTFEWCSYTQAPHARRRSKASCRPLP